MDTSHLLILELVVVGTAVTLYGLIAAYVGARRQVAREGERIERTKQLSEWEKQEKAARPEDTEELSAKYDLILDWAGLRRASFRNLAQLAQFEARRIVFDLLAGARNNLIIAGAGLLIASAGSIWDLAT